MQTLQKHTPKGLDYGARAADHEDAVVRDAGAVSKKRDSGGHVPANLLCTHLSLTSAMHSVPIRFARCHRSLGILWAVLLVIFPLRTVAGPSPASAQAMIPKEVASEQAARSDTAAFTITDVMIPMEDGVELHGRLYRPDPVGTPRQPSSR